MPIFYDRIADQIEELLPEFYQTDGPRFISFIKAYFEFLEKGQLIYKDAADIDYIGLEDGTIAGEAFNADGQRGNMLQEFGTYAPSSITSAKINYEHDVDSGGAQKTSYELDEYVVGSDSGAIGRIDVIGTSSNLYIEQFSEAQFDIDEIMTGMTSGMTAKVAQFKASPLHAANNLLSYADIDKTSGDFLEYFRRDFMPFIDRDILANKRLLQKHVQDLYLTKGTKESYEFLFRILYGLEAEISFPTENVIRPSESEFVQPTVMRLYSTNDLGPYRGGQIKKIVQSVVQSSVYINDIYGISGTNDGLDAYEAELITPYRGSFSEGDTVVLSERDGFRVDINATIRGIMTDIDPTESSIYVGVESGIAGDLEDVIRLEKYDPINILKEDDAGGNILDEDGNNIILQYTVGSQIYEPQVIQLETGTGIGVLLSETSVYDIDGNIVTDYVLLHENTDGYPDILGAPETRTFGNALYQEEASLGSLYTESETFNYKSPRGGTASQSVNVIGSIGRGEITDIVIDDAGTSYLTDDKVVFINTDTGGMHGEANISVTEGLIELELGTAATTFTFTGDGSKTVFSGVSNETRKLGFDPRDVQVFVAGSRLTRETQFTTDQAGQKVTLATAAGNGVIVEIRDVFEGILLESSLRPPQVVFDLITGLPKRDPDTDEVITRTPQWYISNESAGQIRKIEITNPGMNYKSLPQVYIGGYIYYDTFTVGTTLPIGNVISSTNGVTMVVAAHDTVKKRVTVYKRFSDPVAVPTGTITMSNLTAADNGGSTSTTFTILQTNVTQGYGTKLWAWGDRIGSVQKLKMQDVGHDFDEGGIGNYQQHAVVKDISAGLGTNTTVTANLTGTTATIHTLDLNRNIVSFKNVKGIFNDGDYCTTSDSKNFVIGKINPCTARGKLGGVALLDGNYTNDTGFPSVDSQRIHDGQVYQDFSYIIKVGRSINDYRSLIKSLLSPAGTIFFGEVAIRNTVDARAAIYNVNFDGEVTTRAFLPTLIIGSRQDTADIALEDGSVPGGVMELTQTGSIATGGVVGVHTFNPNVAESADQGLKITLQLTAVNAYSNLQIINRGGGYTVGDIVTITKAMVGGSDNTTWILFKVTTVGDPLVTSSSLQFVGDVGRLGLETGEGIMTTERFLAITATTVRDQASGILYTTVPDEPPGAQSYIVGQKFTPATRDFFNRQLVAELSPKGHRVHKELEIYPAYNQHKIYYSTLTNALAVGTKVRGATSNALGIVIKHDTTNKFIIIHRDIKDWGKAGSQFSGTEIIQNILSTGLSSTNYFTATSIELHWVPEDIPVYTVESTPTADSYTITQAQKTATEGGGEPYAHADYISGYIGRGKVLVAGDHSEVYDSEMRQRHITIISSPLYTSGSTQRGRALVGLNHTKTPLNQKGAESYVAGDVASTRRTTTIVTGDTVQPYLAINGTALRLDDIRNSVSELPGDSSVTVLQDTGNSDTSTTRTTNRTGVNISSGVNWGYRPAGQKLFESTNYLSENLISEAGETFVMEDDHGRVMGEYFGQGGIVLLEDDTTLLWETATIADETHYFVSEESTQVGSYNLIAEDGGRIIDESDNRFLLEEALMIGQKESNQSGPSIGDLGNIMFSENYGIMQKVRQESGNVAGTTPTLGNGWDLGDGLMLETGEHMLRESPSEGLRIIDISNTYPNRFVLNLERELGRKTNFNHSAVVQTG